MLDRDFVRQAYDDFTKGGIGAVINLFADDVVWHIGGRSRLSGDYKGKYEVHRFFGELVELSEGTFELAVRDVLVSDERAAVLCTERARRNGRWQEMNTVHVWRLRDRTFTEFWRYPDDTYADDEFWS
jgi:ketosteroid isomerase-like protein